MGYEDVSKAGTIWGTAEGGREKWKKWLRVPLQTNLPQKGFFLKEEELVHAGPSKRYLAAGSDHLAQQVSWFKTVLNDIMKLSVWKKYA